MTNKYNSFEKLCITAAAQGSVLLKNDNKVLPFKSGQRIAVFGRTQTHYYKSGMGSGGMVNTDFDFSIIEALSNEKDIICDKELAKIYKDWIKEHPFDNGGSGWAKEPWNQEEMPLSNDTVLSASKRCDTALVVIGRTAGEDKDSKNVGGSYLLTDIEEDMIKKVSSAFNKTVIVLNVGNIIDMSFLEKYKIDSVLYCFHGGMMGSIALCEVLLGRISPCGKLTDTIAYSIDDYPSTKDFGTAGKTYYTDDIFVGYRYFETFKKDKVLFPFGFGLTYSSFDISYNSKIENETITVSADIKNTGNFTARQTLEVYFEAPSIKLTAPARQLVGFAKTKELSIGESETLTVSIDIKDMASFDENGVTGNKSCYVLEKGNYNIYAGTDVRTAQKITEYNVPETTVTKKAHSLFASNESFDIISADENGELATIKTQIHSNPYFNSKKLKSIEYTGNKGIKLIDVVNGKYSMDEFIAQFSDDDLCAISIGEGMSSPKVTAGTGGAFGGVTKSLLDMGIPPVCVTDGPSGLRLDSKKKATLIPNGTLIASTFDTEITEKLYSYIAKEMAENNIDILLGPGMNIHRNPLNGRNFEYFSEDPYLTGKIAAAVCRGISGNGRSATLKHFCCNNQETDRRNNDVIVTERALREIYLKGFEITVKESDVKAIMTSYNLINGVHCCSNYDLTQTLLRDEWNYKGFVMTDWWPLIGTARNSTKENLKEMVKAHNDIYMVWKDSSSKPHNILDGLKSGEISRGDLQKNVKNLLNYIIISPSFEMYRKIDFKFDFADNINFNDYEIFDCFENIKSSSVFEITSDAKQMYVFDIKLKVDADEISQFPINILLDKKPLISVSQNGTCSKENSIIRTSIIEMGKHEISFDYGKAVKLLRIKAFKRKN